MRQVIIALNQLIAFVLEIGMLISLGIWGFHGEQSTGEKYLLGLGLPLLVAGVWGIWAAPRSAYRLALPYRLLFSFTLFALTAFLLYRLGHGTVAIVFVIFALLSALVELAFD